MRDKKLNHSDVRECFYEHGREKARWRQSIKSIGASGMRRSLAADQNLTIFPSVFPTVPRSYMPVIAERFALLLLGERPCAEGVTSCSTEAWARGWKKGTVS